MRIKIDDKSYTATKDFSVIGFYGEHNARVIDITQPVVDGADMYRLRFEYPDKVVYDVPVEDGKVRLTASMLHAADDVHCQWIASKTNDQNGYDIVAKSQIFNLVIKPSIGNDAIPPPEIALTALDQMIQLRDEAQNIADTTAEGVSEQLCEYADNAKSSAQRAASEAENAAESVKNKLSEYVSDAQSSAHNAETQAASAALSAQQAKNTADSIAESTQQITANTTDIAAIKPQLSDVRDNVNDLNAYIGYTDEDIAGLQVDFKNHVCTRLAGAKDKTAGEDFDVYPMYGGRKRCTVADDGTVTAYYGDENYAEDGSMGQVMVMQPKFYYRVVPLDFERNKTTGIGYHMRKANYYVSSKPKLGFKLHPAFYDENGNPVDYILFSAYEGSMYDASESEYVNDGTNLDPTIEEGDTLCSIAGVKPISGKAKPLTKSNLEFLANNHGTGWHLSTIKAESANQLLMIVELGSMNTQVALGDGQAVHGRGVTRFEVTDEFNRASLTGSTTALGNATGQADETVNEVGGEETIYTKEDNEGGAVSVTYRGVENPWGNIWKHINGVNIWGDGSMAGGQPYISDDFNFSETKNNENYHAAGFTLPNSNQYISAMGWGGDENSEYDWLLMPSETINEEGAVGTAKFVNDFVYTDENLKGYRAAELGGSWRYTDLAGGFCWYCQSRAGSSGRAVGGRLIYVPKGAYIEKKDSGQSGSNGATFTPSVSSDGTLSWTNDKNLPNPVSANIKGQAGEKGSDGVSITNAEINLLGELILFLSNGTTINVGRVVGDKGEKGKDGDDYVLTENDKSEIANTVFAMFVNAEEVEY